MKNLLKRAVESVQNARLARQLDRFSEYDDQRFIREISKFVTSEADRRFPGQADRHFLLYSIQRALMPDFVIADYGRVLLEDSAFRETFARFSDDNWTSFERKWNLKELLRLVSDVPGDLVECGVFRGGSAYLMCEHADLHDRHVHLFDSFEGLSEPQPGEDFHWTKGDLSVPEETVRENLGGFRCFSTYKGWIPERFPEIADREFCFLHIDVDLEKPTRDSLDFFYPRMPIGSVVLLDDHGSAMCPGARKTALEFFHDMNQPVLDLATGQGLVIKR